MCKKGNPHEIDNCLKRLIKQLNQHRLITLGSCCGHGRYHPTIVVRVGELNQELYTGMIIPRKKRFYKKDKDGFYYIPEIEDIWRRVEMKK